MQRGPEHAFVAGGHIPHIRCSSSPHASHTQPAQDQNKSFGKSGSATTPLSVMSDTTVPFSQLTNTEAPVSFIEGNEAERTYATDRLTDDLH